MKVISGIPVLDEMIEEIPEGKVLTYWIDPEVEGNVFAMQTLFTNLERDCRCAYVTLTYSPEVVVSEFNEFGWDVENYKNFNIVDLHSAYVGLPSNCKYSADPTNVDEVNDVLMKVIENCDLVVVPVSSIIDVCGESSIECIGEWCDFIRDKSSRLVFTFVSWPYPEKIENFIKVNSNAIVRVGGVHHRVILGYYYGVVKVDWKNIKSKAILFKLVRPGGVRAYIPKILVTGPYNAGKSTFVHAVSMRSISVDRLGTTVALDHGHLEYRGFSIDLFGTPGQERFDPILKIIGKEALGVILVVDSTKPETFPRAKQMLESVAHFGLPYVVAANKQDLPGALPPEEVRKKMYLPEDVPIIPVSAVNGEGVYEVIDSLLGLLTGRLWVSEDEPESTA
ncbi:MAG: GTP-binding protein [Archaeoglobus sp.]|nr:MAG: GTP-binding protein [Archaeoglobus sp.]